MKLYWLEQAKWPDQAPYILNTGTKSSTCKGDHWAFRASVHKTFTQDDGQSENSTPDVNT